MHLGGVAKGIIVAGVGLSVGASSPQPRLLHPALAQPAPHTQIFGKPAFHWPRTPLAGMHTESRSRSIEVRGFGLGRCTLPAGAAELIAQEARLAASQSKLGRQASATIAGGADGSPIENLNPACAALVPYDRDRNQRLARSRAAYVKRLFLKVFDGAGGDRTQLTWLENPPAVTTNIDRPYDRNAILNLAWQSGLPEAGKVFSQNRSR